ncbi:hypothetical protein O181_072795 [Austropuccinia psidii MF-1]|uniref:Reverse transcriptase domain-containing protein n=1 Tax=Austropuccinia psidii MF-1 TaxID=1389203 RepID=A0A9Q3IBD0_9BASI|nr:hypothetical protein [Austropuccinia psidii MF-1]
MHPLGVCEAAMIFPHPAGSIRLKVEMVVMNNCTSQHFILANDYLKIYGIYINNHKDRYFTIGENKRKEFAFPPEKREITEIRKVNHVNKEIFLSYQLIEAQIRTELTLKMKEELIEILLQYGEAFASDNEPLGPIKGHEVDLILNVERPYRPLLRRPAYPDSPMAREALESHINELMKLGVLRQVGHNEEVDVTTPVIITRHNDKSRMVGDFRALNTYTIPDRYPIPRIHETLTQLSKAKFITSMDAPKGLHQIFLTPHARKLLRIIAHCGIYEFLRMPFGIKNEPSHYQRMMNTILPHELSEGWLALPNTPESPTYVPASAEPQIPIEGINITDVGTEFFEEVRESYKKDKNCHILTALLHKDCKDASLANSLDDIWKTSYDNGQFN